MRKRNVFIIIGFLIFFGIAFLTYEKVFNDDNQVSDIGAASVDGVSVWVDPSLAALKQLPVSEIYFELSHYNGLFGSGDNFTNIYRLTNDGKVTRLYSDLHSDMVINYPCGSGGARAGLVLIANNRAFAVGTLRDPDSFHIDCPRNQNIYELYLDGTNRYKFIAKAQGGGYTIADPFIDHSGAQIGYLGAEGDNRKTQIVLQDTKSGKILNEIPVSKYENNADTSLASVGWLDDDKTLFFSVETADPTPSPLDGYYSVDLQTQKITKLPGPPEAVTQMDRIADYHGNIVFLLKNNKGVQIHVNRDIDSMGHPISVFSVLGDGIRMVSIN